MIRHLERDQFIPGDADRIWRFFATPRNLDALTPPNLRFRIVGEPAATMYAGQCIEYRIGILPGIWTRWLTGITHLREGEFFVDEQRLGPYRLWHHEHYFIRKPGGMQMLDRVTYDPGWGPVGAVVDRLWIAPQLKDVFDFRAQRVAELFSTSGRT